MSEQNDRGEDRLVRVVAEGGAVRAAAVVSTGVGRALVEAHDPSPIGATALGRAATAALLLSTQIKGRQQVGLQINGDGPLGELYALADAHGHVRATVANPRVTLPELAEAAAGAVPVAAAIGHGRLTVIKQLDEGAPYRGVVPLAHGGIGEDLAWYFAHSEQIPSVVGVGELLDADGVVAAGGFLIQALPGADDELLARIEQRVTELPPLAELFAAEATPESLLERLLDDVEVLEEQTVALRCTCDRAHFARNLIALGAAELEALRDEQEVTEVECHFCRSRYTFDREQMSALLLGARGAIIFRDQITGGGGG